jgi:hypothetical protein
MRTPFLSLPGYRRLLRLTATTVLIVAAAGSTWSVWFESWFALSHTLGALQAMNDSAERLAAKRDFDEAELLLRRSLSIQQRRMTALDFGPSLPMELETRAQLALIALARGRPHDAEQAFEELIALAESGLGDGGEQRYVLGSFYSLHGALLIRTDKPAQAHRQLQHAHEALMQALRETDAHTRLVVEEAIELNSARLRQSAP